jgi:flagellar secretion chaperone FliS
MAAPTQEYLKTKVMTASPEMLTLMLWDGAIRFAEQGKEAILKKDIEGSYKALVRSQKIITELTTSLKRDVDRDLTEKLAALYNFIYRRLVSANVTKDEKLVDDALEIMRHQRETWVMLMDKLSKERVTEARATVNANADAVTSAEVAATVVQGRGSGLGVDDLPKGPVGLPGARRGYPAFAVRPAAVSAGLSVQG